jgi:hypothetical protein
VPHIPGDLQRSSLRAPWPSRALDFRIDLSSDQVRHSATIMTAPSDLYEALYY